jgi:HAD superfamily hydrolase (TIGR01549 family)
MATHTYDAWLVDLDGTLYRPLGLKLLMAAELLTEPGAVRVIRAFRREHERMRKEAFACETGSPFDEQIDRTARTTALGTERVREIVLRWMVDKPSRRLRPFRREGLVEEIASYRNAGGKTALVSDYPAEAKLRALEARALFDVVVANGEPGGPCALKPSPAGFLAAATQLGVSPERCLVLGDRDDADGEAALRAGMSFRLVR